MRIETEAAKLEINQSVSKNRNIDDANTFSDILNQAIEQVKTLEVSDKTLNTSVINGDINEIHTAVIEAEKAELALRLTVQIRNKIVEAYNDIMRMQV